jgi:hypothetical protein
MPHVISSASSRLHFLPFWQDEWQDSDLQAPFRYEFCHFGKETGMMGDEVHGRRTLYSVARPAPAFSNNPKS